MKDFGSRVKNLYGVASSQYPVKRLGRTYTERPKSVLGICSKPAAHIIFMGAGPLAAKRTIYGSHSWSGGTIYGNKICHRWSGVTNCGGGTTCGVNLNLNLN